jgi:hypothetical protein
MNMDSTLPRKNVEKRVKMGTTTDEDEALDSSRPCNLHPDDPHNLLKLSAALKTLIGREILEADLVEADKLLREYTSELVDVSFDLFNVGASLI